MSFPYRVNDVVLARVPNGKIYFTKIRSVSVARKSVIAEFDDGSISTVDWTNIFDVAATTDVIVCVVCKQGDSETPNEIILCDTCNVGYHQDCHPSRITADHIAQEKWHCHYCVTKGKNPYVENPFENSRSRSPRRKRKRKLVKSPPKPKPNPKKRRKVGRPPLKSSHLPKSYVAKKCTVSIVKQSMTPELESVAPALDSDSSNSSSEQATSSPHTENKTLPNPPVPLTLPQRPVNAVQPLNHMAYPVCSPPPLQMSPLVKKPPYPRVQSCSPPPLTVPRDIVISPDAVMTSLPPLQRARDVDPDPLRNIPDLPSSSWSSNSQPPSKLKKSPICETHPVQPTDSAPEPPAASDQRNNTNPNSPSSSQPPQRPPTDSISNISSDQIRGLYMRLYDFLQQTRAQGNPVIDREVVQHLISYGNDQIQKLSSSGSTSSAEQSGPTSGSGQSVEAITPSTASQVNSSCSADSTVEHDTSSCGTERNSSISDKSTKVIETQRPSDCAESGSEPAEISEDGLDGRAETASCSTSHHSPKKTVAVGSPKVSDDLKNLEKRVPPPTSVSAVLEPILSFVKHPFSDSTSESKLSSESAVDTPVEPVDSSEHCKTIVSSVESKIANEAPKNLQESKLTLNLVCQPLEPAAFNSVDFINPFIRKENVKKRTSKTKTKITYGLPPHKHGLSTAKSDSVKSQCKKPKKVAKESKKSVLPRKGSTRETAPNVIPSYSAVQAGNSVIITPNSVTSPSAENSVPVQFISGVDAHADSSDELSKIFAEYSGISDPTVTTTQPTKLLSELPYIPTNGLSCPVTEYIETPMSVDPTSSNCAINQLPQLQDEPSSSCLYSVPTNTQENAVITTDNDSTYLKTYPSDQSEYNTIAGKNKTVEPKDVNAESADVIEHISQVLPHFAIKTAQLQPTRTSSMPGTESQSEEMTTLKPRARKNSNPSSSMKRKSASDRQSKSQARVNIKSFTIFDSYSSLFDSDGDEDDEIFVTQKPTPQLLVPSIPQNFDNFVEYCKTDKDFEDATKSTDTDQVSYSVITEDPVPGTPVPESTTEPGQVSRVTTTTCPDDLIRSPDYPATSNALSKVSSPNTSSDLLNTTFSTIPPLEEASFADPLTASNPSFTKTAPASSSDNHQEDTNYLAQNRSLIGPSSSPPSEKPNSTVNFVAKYIQQAFSQLLLVATVRRASELAVEAAVIRLEEGWASLNLLTAALLHGLVTTAFQNNKMRVPGGGTETRLHNPCPVPVPSPTNQPSFIDTQQHKLLRAPTSVSNLQNMPSPPVVNSHNLSSVPVVNSQNLSTTPVFNSQIISSVPDINSNIQSPLQVMNPQHPSPAPVLHSSNISPAPALHTANLSPAPVLHSANISSATVILSEDLSTAGTVISPQNHCSIPTINTSTPLRGDKLEGDNTSDENCEPNKNNITGQCYNCYSPAMIACRRCSTALYCSLRCELEHLAIHRRECCKRRHEQS